MQDWFKKATSTLQTGAMFVKYVVDNYPNSRVLPIGEAKVYDYVDYLLPTEKPLTRAHACLGTLRFVSFELGWQGADFAAASLESRGVRIPVI